MLRRSQLSDRAVRPEQSAKRPVRPRFFSFDSNRRISLRLNY
jgi:hypothetical protein